MSLFRKLTGQGGDSVAASNQEQLDEAAVAAAAMAAAVGGRLPAAGGGGGDASASSSAAAAAGGEADGLLEATMEPGSVLPVRPPAEGGHLIVESARLSFWPSTDSVWSVWGDDDVVLVCSGRLQAYKQDTWEHLGEFAAQSLRSASVLGDDVVACSDGGHLFAWSLADALQTFEKDERRPQRPCGASREAWAALEQAQDWAAAGAEAGGPGSAEPSAAEEQREREAKTDPWGPSDERVGWPTAQPRTEAHEVHRGSVRRVAHVAPGIVASGGSDNCVVISETKNLTRLRVLTQHKNTVWYLCDGGNASVVTGSAHTNEVRVLNWQNGHQLHHAKVGSWTMSCSVAGSRIYTGGERGEVQVFDRQTFALVGTVVLQKPDSTDHTSDIWGMAACPTGVIAVTTGGIVAFISPEADITHQETLEGLPGGDGAADIRAITILPSGRILLAGNSWCALLGTQRLIKAARKA